VPALPGVNANLAAPYNFVVVGDGFSGTGVRDASGATVAPVSLLALPATKQIVMTVDKSVFGAANLGTATYAVAMLSHADGNSEGLGDVRPVYSLAYWNSTVGTGMSWIHDFRFGGGAGQWIGNSPWDDDTRDPNTIDIIVPAGSSQSTVLDWTAGSPVTLPYVPLG
jgi:hypothetical protein